MADPLNRLQKAAGRRIVLVSASPLGFKAAVVERAAGSDCGWKFIHVTEMTAGLEMALVQLPQGSGARQAVLATSACRVLLLNQTVPERLPPEQAREMLRWEVEASLAAESAEEGRSTPGHISWETGYAGVSNHQTAVAASDPAWIAEVNGSFQKAGLALIAVVPSLALGWSALAKSGMGGGVAAVAQHTGEACSLTVFERGQMEFFMTYPAAPGSWPRNLAADARSFSLKKWLVLREHDADEAGEHALPGLPNAEPQAANWPWEAMLGACGLLAHQTASHRVPVVMLLEAPQQPWKKPALWWAAAAALIFLLATPKMLDWRGQIQALESQKQMTVNSLQETMDKLRVFAADAQAYDQLEAEFKSLQTQIEQAAREAEKPGRAACAQVAYAKDALRAMAISFDKRARVKQFKTDFQGRIFIQGDSRGDAVVLNALEEFYKLLAEHPVKPAAVSTTKEGAAPGMLLFTADDAANPLAVAAAPAAPANPVSAAPAAAPASHAKPEAASAQPALAAAGHAAANPAMAEVSTLPMPMPPAHAMPMQMQMGMPMFTPDAAGQRRPESGGNRRNR